VLIIAGSPSMLGASALSSLAALRSGAGLVTAAVPKSLNLTLQEKISNCIMTKPLAENKNGTYSLKAYGQIKLLWDQFDALAIGPGLGRDSSTQQLARQVIIHCPKPLVIDADALFALSGHTTILLKAAGARVLTPHVGEMARLTGLPPKQIEASRSKIACDFARKHHCILLLKGHRTVVASSQGRAHINHTGNAGMAKAGSGDVLTGMLSALLAQDIVPFEAAKLAAYWHGKAGDYAARQRPKASMIATDIIEAIFKEGR